MTDETEDPEATHPMPLPEVFLEWRSLRFGQANPEAMSNPAWEWLIRTRLSGHQATERMRGPSPFDVGPTWSFQRFGTSVTVLPDGREIHVAGEHEDHYDPDFHIYNDVVVKHPDGHIDVFGYPEADFPPTDFHSATLVRGDIIVIGNLGRQVQRKPGFTPVYALAVDDMQFREIRTEGVNPGWIHKHRAALSDDGTRIVISGGEVDTGNEETGHLENIDDWALNLHTFEWERLTQRVWSRARVQREDQHWLSLWEIRSASHMAKARQNPLIDEIMREQMQANQIVAERLDEIRKVHSQADFELLDQLFHPPLPWHPLAAADDQEEEFGVARIEIQGVPVRYREDGLSITITIEGELSSAMISTLVEDMRSKLEQLEKSPCVAVMLPSL